MATRWLSDFRFCRNTSSDSTAESPTSDEETHDFPRVMDRNYSGRANETITRNFINSMFRDLNGANMRRNSDYHRVMRDLMEKVKEKSNMSDLVLLLNIENGSCASTFTRVADNMFVDGEINWGRIATFFAFIENLIIHCKEQHDKCDQQELRDTVVRYSESKLGDWINEIGGWDDLVEKFANDKFTTERTKKTLMVLSGAALAVVGLLSLRH